ncbi:MULTISPECIES: YcaO-like family protein [unclassified Amycolatopsis]|uniref:YcaO-like family protein n=1 Tax=unclassified Amycolatopsis TaxID=2618356 RepID=UPI0014312D6B|nr:MULTISPECIES: YcaO-like family protein [unclassified Amycolatopsis]
MGFLYGPRFGPRFMCAGGDLTGVHVLRDQPAPKPGSYHIGGYGVLPFESHIRTLGETIERYAGYVAAVSGRFPVLFRPYSRMLADGLPVPGESVFDFFDEEQLRRRGFPFAPFDAEAPIGWIRVASLSDGEDAYVPAQLFLVGYVVRDLDGEPWLNAAVTTGTAAHTTGGAALLSAMQEAIQLDAAIGHWHGARRSTRIQADRRTQALEQIIAAYLPPHLPKPEFHLLPSADLPGHVVACLLRDPNDAFPAIVVGMGVDGRLAQAMYKSLLEAMGVRHLAVIAAVNDQASIAGGVGSAHRSSEDRGHYDLESNVIRYARPDQAHLVERRFADHDVSRATELPPDDVRPLEVQARQIVAAYRETGKRLYYADLTTPDVRDLGFLVSRVWSPDTLSLPLPDAPPAVHPRFAAYGGFQSHAPHPYP